MTHDSLSAAKAMQNELSSRAQDMDEARRLPNDLAHDMAKAGLFRIITPDNLGGYEATPLQFMETLEALAEANASASWCAMIACTSTLASAYMDEQTAAEIFGDSDVIAGGIFAPMGTAKSDGSDYIVNGRWQWASGSQNCHWIGGGARIEDTNEGRMCFFRAGDVELIDTWHVAGLKGTGSGDMVVKNVRVPKSRSVNLTLDKPRETGPLYTFPPFGLLGIGVAAVALGNAGGALQSFQTLAMSKKNQGSGRTLSERQVIQSEIAKTQAQFKSARAYLLDEIEQTWREATQQGVQSIDRRAALRLACTHMTRTCADVTRTVYDLAGGAALFETSDLQRRFRDAHAMTQHIVTAPATYELMGRVMFGLPTNDGMI